jgi:hypothetical protein
MVKRGPAKVELTRYCAVAAASSGSTASVFVNSPGIGFDAFHCMPGIEGAHE